ncbi:hypothetical protein MMC22_004319 [Lobaria immixta]|nr:hypothetical protein [Lobaria immixta]
MCFSWGGRDKYAYTSESQRQRDHEYDFPRQPHEIPQAHFQGFDGRTGGASQRGGYQPVQGMQARRPSNHAGGRTAADSRGGSVHLGGRNNPYGEDRSAAGTSRRTEASEFTRSGTGNSRRGGNTMHTSRRNGGNTPRGSGGNTSRRSGAEASTRNRNQGTGALGAHSDIHNGRFIPDAVTRRPSPPPLRRRRR